MASSHDQAQVPSAVLAVLVHVFFFVVLFFGVRWTSTAPDAVVVELWTQPPVPEATRAPQPEPAPPPPKVEPPPPKPVPKAQPKPAPKAPPKAVPETKKPHIAVEKQKKAAKKPEPKPVPKPEPKLDLDARARMEELLAKETQALAEDRAKRQAVKPAAPPPSAPVIDSGYVARIRAKIRGNIVVPPDIQGDPEAIFDVIQLPTGEVLTVRLRKSSGHKAYDQAIERAILKASPLPRPDKAEQFQRQLELKFRPKDPV